MRSFVGAVPWFLPGVALWTVLATLASKPLARFLETKRVIAFGLLMSVGLIVFATLSPNAPSANTGVCDLSRIGFASLTTLRYDYDAGANIVLFLPLGFMLGLLPRTRQNVAIMLGAFSFTVLIELTQLLVTDLGRGCETADMVDNTVGLAIGLAAGMVVTLIGRLTTRT